MELWKDRRTDGRTDRMLKRRMPVLNPTIQLVVVYQYTKYEHFIFKGSRDIFDEKVLRNYRRMDGQI